MIIPDKYMVLPMQRDTYTFYQLFMKKGISKYSIERTITHFFETLCFYYPNIREISDYRFYLHDLFKDMLLQNESNPFKEYEIPVYFSQFNEYFDHLRDYWEQFYLVPDGFVYPRDKEVYYSHYFLMEIKMPDLIFRLLT